MSHITNIVRVVRTVWIPSLIALFTALPVRAVSQLQENLQEVGDASGVYATDGGNSLPAIVGGVLQQIMGLLGIVMVVLIIYGGFIYMTAGGDDAKVGKAKKIIINSVIGIVIILTAYAITDFIVGAILQGTGAAGA